jgi:transcriptional regulatory protein LevR
MVVIVNTVTPVGLKVIIALNWQGNENIYYSFQHHVTSFISVIRSNQLLQ